MYKRQFVVLVVLIAIVGAIFASWVRAHKQGRHIACDECGGCSAHNPDPVSYTHLDVYKRQEHAISDESFDKWLEYFKAIGL